MEDSQLHYSVLITTYNSSDFIVKALDSVFAQSIKPRQIILVDDCSTDDTLSLLSKYPIEIVKMPINSGAALARDAGLSLITSVITFVLDADDCWDDGHVEHHLKIWNSSNTKIGAVCSNMRLVFHDSVLPSQQYPFASKRVERKQIGILELAAHNPFFSSATSFRTSILKEIGGWSFAEQKFCADYWVLTELLLNGYKVEKILQETGTYLVSGENQSSNLIEVFKSETLAMNRLLEHFKDSNTLKSYDETKILCFRYISQLTRIFRRFTFFEVFKSSIFPQLIALYDSKLIKLLDLKLCRVCIYILWRLSVTARKFKNVKGI
jgi:glycosyltransferase involved in cell wall biosynthesis